MTLRTPPRHYEISNIAVRITDAPDPKEIQGERSSQGSIRPKKAKSAVIVRFGVWQGRLSPVIRLLHLYQAGDRRKRPVMAMVSQAAH